MENQNRDLTLRFNSEILYQVSMVLQTNLLVWGTWSSVLTSSAARKLIPVPVSFYFCFLFLQTPNQISPNHVPAYESSKLNFTQTSAIHSVLFQRNLQKTVILPWNECVSFFIITHLFTFASLFFSLEISSSSAEAKLLSFPPFSWKVIHDAYKYIFHRGCVVSQRKEDGLSMFSL